MSGLHASLLSAVVTFVSAMAQAPTAEQHLRRGEYREALALVEEQLAAGEEDPAALFHRGQALVGLLRYRDAAEAFERVVELDRTQREVLIELVVIYGQLGEPQKLERALTRLGAPSGLSIDARIRLARALRKTGAHRHARRTLEDAQPMTEEAYLELGLASVGEGDCEAAMSYLERAGSGADVALARGRCLEGSGRPSEAIAQYRLALEGNSKLGTARFRLGNLLLREGERDEGLALLDDYELFRQWERRVKLLLAMVSSGTLPPEDTRIKKLELVDLYLQGNAGDDAARVIASGLDQAPGDPALLTARARWQLAAGDVAGAHASLENLLRLEEPPVDALWLSARLQLNAGRVPDAIASYERFLSRVPAPPSTLLKELGTAHALQGNVSEAIRFFERAVAVDPGQADARADLGLLLESQGRKEEAEELYRAALSIDPGLVSAQQGLGSLLLERGQLESAEALFRRSTELVPADPALRRNLALVLSRMGREAEAREQMRRAQELER